MSVFDEVVEEVRSGMRAMLLDGSCDLATASPLLLMHKARFLLDGLFREGGATEDAGAAAAKQTIALCMVALEKIALGRKGGV